MDAKARKELESLLRDEKKRLEDRGIGWDVADVLDLVEAFLDARGVLQEPKPRKGG